MADDKYTPTSVSNVNLRSTNSGQQRICCPESNMSVPTVASDRNRQITPVSPRKQSDRENRRRTSPENDVTAPAVSFYRPRNQINRENLRRTNPGNSVTEKITDGPPRKQCNCSSISITEDHLAGRLKISPGNDVTAPANSRPRDPGIKSTGKISDGLV